MIKFLNKLKKKIVEYRVFRKELHNWKKLSKQKVTIENHRNPHVIIMPPDPLTIGGSRGDEAMIVATIDYFKKVNPEYRFSIIIKDRKDYINNLNIPNLSYIDSFNGNYPLKRIYESIIENQPTDIVIIGADVMDGHYSPYISLILLAIYDLCLHIKNARTHITGFSWNKTPSYLIKDAIRASKYIPLNLRDIVSLNRFVKNTGASNTKLVADVAFLLHSKINSEGYNKLHDWIYRHPNAINLGVNFHPMLRKYNTTMEVKQDAILLSENIFQVLKNNQNINIVLLSHDDRGTMSDNVMLDYIYEFLIAKNISDRVYYDSKVYRANEIKGICSLLDGLFSSRMHLAIAALGVGTPILTVSYQDKFEGLYEHFNYNKHFLMSYNQSLTLDFIQIFDEFVNSLPQLKKLILSKLPEVTALSESNFKN